MSFSLLAKSTRGASFLILLQVASRALTFIDNQILLRFLSPAILGVATQLELFSISTLYFSRESTRVALQRRRSDPISQPKDPSEDGESRESRSLREAITLSSLSITLGVPLTLVFQYLYTRSATPSLLSTPYFLRSLNIYAVATILELCHEPFFAIMQQNLSYSIRTAAEMQATLLRCVITCSTAIYAHTQNHSIGVLPFALGQLSYSILLLLGYYIRLRSQLPPLFQSTHSRPGIPSALLKLTGTLYAQSLFKQLLTSGDSYLITLFTSLSSQGAYALASNYGGLLARVFFQPIEEASRTLLAQLLPPLSDTSRSAGSKEQQAVGQDSVALRQATTYLTLLLRLYALLALVLMTLAPPLTSPLLSLVAGSRWTATEAPSVLSAYCYYIPLLAINGLLEAYVSAVATPAQLRTQSVVMVGWSVMFAALGLGVLAWGDGGARGLVVVNGIVMVGRIAWSVNFVKKDLKDRGGSLDWKDVMPRSVSLAPVVVGRAVLERWVSEKSMGMGELARVGAVVGICGIGVVGSEREFLWRMVGMMRPMSRMKGQSSGGEKGK